MEPSGPTGTLPQMPPAPDIPGPVTAEDLMSQLTPGTMSAPPPGAVSAALAAASAPPAVPEMESAGDMCVELPAGLIDGESLITSASVRELTGYDEEALSHLDETANYGKYVTKMLELGVDELGGARPTLEQLRDLLIGDRDALILGIRRATYGRDFKFDMTCPSCERVSNVVIDLIDDIPVNKLDDPYKRVFEVPDTRRRIKVKLLDGAAQEAFSEGIAKKTGPEVDTVTLAQSVIEIDGNPTGRREDPVLKLSAHDRQKVLEFLGEHTPGPQTMGIPVECATCHKEYPYSVGLGSLFR